MVDAANGFLWAHYACWHKKGTFYWENISTLRFCVQGQMLTSEFIFCSLTHYVKHLLLLYSYEYDIQKYIVAYVTIRKTYQMAWTWCMH